MRRAELAELADGLEALMVWLRRLAPNTVSTSTMTTLGTLEAHGPLRISELAEGEAISQPGMTTLVNRLEAEGLAERFADPTDGRASLVRITPRGRRMLADRHAARRDAVLAELHRLDPVDRTALAAALPAMQALVDNRTTTKETAV